MKLKSIFLTRTTAFFVLLFSIFLLDTHCFADDRFLVRDGKPMATIVIGNTSQVPARRAAKELNKHLKLATGVTLPIVKEGMENKIPKEQTIVLIGGGKLADSLDIPKDFKDEEFVVKTQGRYLVFAGSDTVIRKKMRYRSPATQWAVGLFLDRYMGVRWLWPGEIGTFVPKTPTIAVKDVNIRHQPPLLYRSLGLTLRYSNVKKASVTRPDVTKHLVEDTETWMKRHQIGQRQAIGAMHAFDDWWEKYHKKYPDIFATLPEGKKQPYPKPQRIKLCVSNPKVADLILAEWRTAGRPDTWNVSPNDGQGYCVCQKCRALDVPPTFNVAPMDIVMNRDKVVLTGRYLNLWTRLLYKMRQENPRVALKSLAYANYRKILPEMKPLNYTNALYATFVPEGYSSSTRNLFSEWKRVGAKSVFYSNYWAVGEDAPYLPLHREGDIFKYAIMKNMVAGVKSILSGHWAIQGIRDYIIVRLMERPDLSVDAIIDEYTSAFGKGAPAIREYLEYWEKISDIAEFPNWMGRFEKPGGLYQKTLKKHNMGGSMDLSPFRGCYYIMPFLYDDKCLAKARGFLDRAEALAGKEDIMACRRIAFLRDGLKCLELTRNVVALANAAIRPKVTGPDALCKQEDQFKRLLVELKNLRTDLNTRHVVWADFIAAYEDRRKVKFGEKYADPFVQSAKGMDLKKWRFRKDPKNVGVKRKWFVNYPMEAREWRPIKVPAFWDKAGVGNYQGYGWYQTTFRMPHKWQYDSLVLSFGAVDEQAWIYVNGRLVGEHTIASESRKDIEGASVKIGDLWDAPFAITVPKKYLRLGAENTLVVRVHNKAAAGGIWGNVSIGTPASSIFFMDTKKLAHGIPWKSDKSYTCCSKARILSGMADITIDGKTNGVIMEAGSQNEGWALYIHNGRLYFQCGNGKKFRAANQAVINIPIKAGRHLIEWSVDQTRHKAIVRIDGKVAGISKQPMSRYIADNDSGGIGKVHGDGICDNAAGWSKSGDGAFTGTIHSATVWPDKVCF
jgi:hypothetical protein